MPFRTVDPVLTIEESRMRNIDPQNPENLFGMWSVFHKCSGILEHGKRLENLSWRVFAHETLCVSPKRRKPWSATPAFAHHHHHTQHHVSSSMPELSSSVESTISVESEEVEHRNEESISPREHRFSFADHGRSRDKHITPIDLENLVFSIKVKQDLTRPISPLPMSPPPAICEPAVVEARRTAQETETQESIPTPRPSSPRPVESSTSTIATDGTSPSTGSATYDSETSADSDKSHSVVRGFRTGSRGVSTYRSQSQLALAPPHQHHQPISHPPADSTEMPILPRKRGGMFMLGGSLTEDEASLRDHLSPQSQELERMSVQRPHSHKKHASFLDKVTEIPKRTFILSSSQDDGNAIESDDEDAYDTEEEEVSESAIEDDDDWEDEAESEDSARQLTFARVDSKPNLVSRRSIITEGLHEGQRATALQNAASRSTPLLRRSRTSTPNGPSMPASPDEHSLLDVRASPDGPSKPIIMTTTNVAPSALPLLSPRATRRNMLSSELGMSLRKHMLNERQQKNAGYTAALQRRHTAHDMKGLSHYPEAGGAVALGGPSNDTTSRNNSWNDYFDYGLGEYHQKGW